MPYNTLYRFYGKLWLYSKRPEAQQPGFTMGYQQPDHGEQDKREGKRRRRSRRRKMKDEGRALI